MSTPGLLTHAVRTVCLIRNITILKFLYMGCSFFFLERQNLFLKGLNSQLSALNKHILTTKLLIVWMALHSQPRSPAHACKCWVDLPFPHSTLKDECLTSHRVGAVLYTSYLSILGTLYQPSSQSVKRTYPPPPVYCTALSGFSAGVVQYVRSVLILYLLQETQVL